MELVKTRLPNNMGIPPEQIQVLSPTRKRTAGTASLNRAIQEAVNPPGPDRPERRFGEYIILAGATGSMQVRNNYDVVWKDGLTVSGMGVFNGISARWWRWTTGPSSSRWTLTAAGLNIP
ncbi:MAG: hypothetical protein ACLRWQ_21495 [Flavonifractor plautii]